MNIFLQKGNFRLLCRIKSGNHRKKKEDNDMPNFDVKITSPRHGDILNRHDGNEGPEGLRVNVRGVAPAGAKVTVNGTEARWVDEAFECETLIASREATITANAEVSGVVYQDSIRVLWDRGSFKRFRFSVDDNIQFLKDLGLNPGTYASLFDHWYLDFWR